VEGGVGSSFLNPVVVPTFGDTERIVGCMGDCWSMKFFIIIGIHIFYLIAFISLCVCVCVFVCVIYLFYFRS